MARVAGLDPTLQNLHDVGALEIRDGKAYLRIEIKEEGKEGFKPSLLDFANVLPVTAYAVGKFIDKQDTVGSVMRERRKQAVQMLLDGFMPDGTFDSLFGEGQAQTEREKATPKA